MRSTQCLGPSKPKRLGSPRSSETRRPRRRMSANSTPETASSTVATRRRLATYSFQYVSMPCVKGWSMSARPRGLGRRLRARSVSAALAIRVRGRLAHAWCAESKVSQCDRGLLCPAPAIRAVEVMPGKRWCVRVADAQIALGTKRFGHLHALELAHGVVAVARQGHLGAGGLEHRGERAAHVEVER